VLELQSVGRELVGMHMCNNFRQVVYTCVLSFVNHYVKHLLDLSTKHHHLVRLTHCRPVCTFYFTKFTLLAAVLRVVIWPGGILVWALDSRLKRSQVQGPALGGQVTTLGRLFTRMYLCHQAV